MTIEEEIKSTYSAYCLFNNKQAKLYSIQKNNSDLKIKTFSTFLSGFFKSEPKFIFRLFYSGKIAWFHNETLSWEQKRSNGFLMKELIFEDVFMKMSDEQVKLELIYNLDLFND